MARLICEPYRIPAVLRDLHLVDLLELTGSTTASAALIGVSQPSVSRRYRSLAADLGLRRASRDPIGQRYGHTPWLQLLRRGVNSHRLAMGVLRIGGVQAASKGLQGLASVEWVSLGRQQRIDWQPLLQLELLDAVALAEPPPETAAMALPYRLLPFQQGWLACRPDPEVLQLAAGLCDGALGRA